MGRLVIRVAADPLIRYRALWNLVAFAVATVYLVIGAGYAIDGHGLVQSPALNLVQSVEQSLHVHGVILMVLAAFLLYGLPDYRPMTRVGLGLVLFYSLWVSALIFGGWRLYGVSWGAPWWYLLTAVLSAGLLVLAPPPKSGQRRVGAVRGPRA